jgi:hypothetical protein
MPPLTRLTPDALYTHAVGRDAADPHVYGRTNTAFPNQ